MATIRKRRDRWQVQVRRDGQPAVRKTFVLRGDAEKWAREQEIKADRGELRSRCHGDLKVFGDLLRRYRDEISPKKKGGEIERMRLNALLRHPLAATPLAKIDRAMLATYRDERLRRVFASTLRRDLALIGHVFRLADIERDAWHAENPVHGIAKPASGPPRTRRLVDGEFHRLCVGLDATKNTWLKPFALFAIETGMRRGEVLSLCWADVDLAKRHAHLRTTKNGHPRAVPLSSAAIRILEGLPRTDSPSVFGTTPEAVEQAWKRCVRRAGLIDLRIHDLRHEAISRFFERGLSIPEVALISGHRDPRMLFRYTHLRSETVLEKLGQPGANSKPGGERCASSSN